MNIDVDLRVDLNTEDDTGPPVGVRPATLADPALLKEGAWLVVGSGSDASRRPGRPDRRTIWSGCARSRARSASTASSSAIAAQPDPTVQGGVNFVTVPVYSN